jgi:HK97 family phage major capsid protein
MWIRAVFAHDEAAKRWCINHGVESRALSEGTGTAGGVLVPDELNQAIISLRETYGVFRQEAEVIPMGRDVMEIPRDTGDLTATFTGENTALTESDPTFNNVTLTAKKLGIITRFSSELAEDAIIDIADFVARKMAWAFAFKEDTVGFNGDGTAGHGSIDGIAKIFDDDNTLAGATDPITANCDTFAEVAAQDVALLMGLIPAYAAQNAKFYCSRVAAELVFGRLQAAGGGNTIQTLTGQTRRLYLGHEVVESQVLATTTGAINNTTMLLFGDLRQSSSLGDRRGIMVKTSEDRYFELDQIAIKATERFSIVNHDYGDGTNAGPIVALIGNT